MQCITKQYLNLGLHILDGVAWLHFKNDGLASLCLDKDLHATSQTKNQVQRRLFLDVVVTEGATIFQLLATKLQNLYAGWNALFVLNLGLQILDGVAWIHFKSDGLASQCLEKDLHAT